jgi:hypothetical protein
MLIMVTRKTVLNFLLDNRTTDILRFYIHTKNLQILAKKHYYYCGVLYFLHCATNNFEKIQNISMLRIHFGQRAS